MYVSEAGASLATIFDAAFLESPEVGASYFLTNWLFSKSTLWLWLNRCLSQLLSL